MSADPLIRLQFVRMATEVDVRAGSTDDLRDSLWVDPHTGEEGFLDPARVMRFGLTDRMREGLLAQDDVSGITEGPPEATDADQKPNPRPAGVEVLGGHTDVWRWQRVQDGDEILWCIDNKPALTAHEGLPMDAPEFQKIVVPDEILRVIVGV